MNEHQFLVFKAYINSVLTVLAGVMGYLEVINGVLAAIGAFFFCIVSGLTAWKLYKEQFVKDKKDKE